MSNPILWTVLAAIIAMAAIVRIARLIDGRPLGRPPARPGLWYGRYHLDWSTAFPGAWERGERQSGGFYKGDVWGSSTLSWDREWFEKNGMRMPRRAVSVAPKPLGPNEFRIGSLGAGESMSFPVIVAGNADGTEGNES